MSESTPSSREMITSYLEFINAYDKCRKIFELDDEDFQGKLFSVVLKEILEISIVNEKQLLQRIETVVPAVETELGISDNKGESPPPADSSSIPELPSDFAGFLHNLLASFNQFTDEKRSRFIVFFVCQKISFYSSNHHAIYEDFLITNKNDDDDVFDRMWRDIDIEILVEKITDSNNWVTKMVDLKIPGSDASFGNYFDKNITLFDFFNKNIKNIFHSHAKLFPKLNSYGKFCISMKGWRQVEKTLSNVDFRNCEEKAGDNCVFFQNPVLVTLDANGVISGRVSSTYPLKLDFYYYDSGQTNIIGNK